MTGASFGLFALHATVERGLLELKRLGIETQLWEATRRGTGLDFSNRGSQSGSEN